MKGDRISFWIPKKFRWIRNAIKAVRRKGSEHGVPLSEADIILAALVPFLAAYRDSDTVEEVEADAVAGAKRSVICRNKDLWLFECIDKIVKGKKAMGIKSSFSYELVRLAKNGFFNSMEGHKLDVAILGKKDADTKKRDT